jgi:hypothetical protein
MWVTWMYVFYVFMDVLNVNTQVFVGPWMRIYIYIYVIFMYVCICTYAFIFIYAYVHICIHAYIRTCIHILSCINVRMPRIRT